MGYKSESRCSIGRDRSLKNKIEPFDINGSYFWQGPRRFRLFFLSGRFLSLFLLGHKNYVPSNSGKHLKSEETKILSVHGMGKERDY